MTPPSKLNVGCGGRSLEGYVNLDKEPYPHVDIRFDLETCGSNSLPVPDNTFDYILLHHVIEHINNVLPMMQELWRVAKPGCSMAVACPYGSTNNADEDPTHVRRLFPNSFVYFSQAWYGENSYGYCGDWDLRQVILNLRGKYFADAETPAQMQFRIDSLRNVVDELMVEMIAVKPARKPGFKPTKAKVKHRLV